jgi:sugar lactone lactonase YvrE
LQVSIVTVLLTALVGLNSARFNRPNGIAVDPLGNVFVADTGNHTIRMISSDRTVSTVAGSPGTTGVADGKGGGARFSGPRGVAVDSAGVIYVADTGSHMIRRISKAGDVTTLAGAAGQFGSADGQGAQARFYGPTALALDRDGNLWVADSSNDTIRKITPSGLVSTVAGRAREAGSKDGIGAGARFSYPCGIAVDFAGMILISDSGNRLIRRMTPRGVVTTLSGVVGRWDDTATDGDLRSARFSAPVGIAVDVSGSICIADAGNGTIRRISPTGEVTILAGQPRAGSGGTDPPKSPWRFRNPLGLAADELGNTYVADSEDSTVLRVSREGGVTLLAGVRGSGGAEDGAGGHEPDVIPKRPRLRIAGDRSPDGRFVLWQEDLEERGHALFVRDEKSSTERKLLEFLLHVDFWWFCGFRGIVINDFGDGQRGRALLVFLETPQPPIDLGQELIQQMTEEDREAVLENERVQFQVYPDIQQDDQFTLMVRGAGRTDPDGFVIGYLHRLGGPFTRLSQYCVRRERGVAK